VKLIKEHINFERGKDPLDAMGIGSKALIMQKYSNEYGDEVAKAYLLLKPYLEESGFRFHHDDLDAPIYLLFIDDHSNEVEIRQKNTIGGGIHGCRIDLRLAKEPSMFFKPGYTRFDDGNIVNLFNKWHELFPVNESINFDKK